MGLFGKTGRAKSKQSTTTLIADGCQITGELRLSTDIQVDGIVHGKINADKTLIISPSGHLIGDAYASTIIINGRVEGALYADAVDILSHGQVSGTIFSDDLSIERGGKFNGDTHPGPKSSAAAQEREAEQQDAEQQPTDESDGEN